MKLPTPFMCESLLRSRDSGKTTRENLRVIMLITDSLVSVLQGKHRIEYIAILGKYS